MPDKEKAYIFHVLMENGEHLMLNPFRGAERLDLTLRERSVVGRFGTEPRVEVLTMFRSELYRSVDTAVKRWLAEKRFIPRFLISAGVFVIAMFLMAYAFRGGLPIPIIDELAISLALSIGVYFAIGKKEQASDAATKKRVSLKTAIDRITFEQSPLLLRVEEMLQRYEASSTEELVPEILASKDEPIDEKDQAEAKSFVRLLEEQFNFARLRKAEKMLKNFMSERGPDRGSNLRRWAESNRISFPLYAVYTRFKLTVERRR